MSTIQYRISWRGTKMPTMGSRSIGRGWGLPLALIQWMVQYVSIVTFLQGHDLLFQKCKPERAWGTDKGLGVHVRTES